MADKQKVLVVGAGLMGCGIATLWAKGGHDVTLVRRDASEQSKAETKGVIAKALQMLVANNALLEEEVEPALARVDVTADMGAAAEATFVIETWPEKLEMKQKLFGELDKLAPPETILATNSTTLTLAQQGINVAHKERFLSTHFYVPAYIIPLVEISRTEETADWAVEKAYELMIELGKVPVLCKDIAGYIGPRLQGVLCQEAVRLLEEGVASAEDIDKAVRNSFAPRLAVFGPLEMADRGGLDIWKGGADVLYGLFGKPWYAPAQLLKDKVAKGELGVKTGKGFYDAKELLSWGHDRQLIGVLQYLGQLPKVK